METRRKIAKNIGVTATLVTTAGIIATGFYGVEKLNRTVKITKNENSVIQREVPATSITLDLLCISVPGDTLFNRLSELKTDEGYDLFTCGEIIAFRNDGGTLEYAKELASMKGLDGKPFFTGYDLVAFKHAGGTIEYARKFLSVLNSDGRPFSGSSLPQLYRLGLEVKDIVHFKDTSKPNALLVYPTHDGELKQTSGNYGAFRTEYTVQLDREIRKTYDVKTVVASLENELYDALDESKGFDFLMISGHGTETTLSLGEKDLRVAKAEKDETYTIDITDTELEQPLQSLDPKAIIFLNSCSTGKGGEGAHNLANAFATWAKGREVIAAQEVLWTGKVLNLNPYPFDVTLMDKDDKRDITYRITINP